MSVVEIRGRVVRDEKCFLDAGLSDRSFLLLNGGLPPEVFSVELSVGASWSERYGPSSNQMYRIPEEGLRLARHGSIVIEVAENLRVPHNMYGLVVPTGSLFLDRGVLIAPAKVEPSYSGTLKLRLFNTTSYKHCLKPGDKVASVVFFSTENTSFQPTVTKMSIPVDSRVPVRRRLKGWASRNANQIIGWVVSAAFGSVSALLIAHYFLEKSPATQGAGHSAPVTDRPNDKGQ